MENRSRIELKVLPLQKRRNSSYIVRVRGDAYDKLCAIQNMTGLSITHIASEMILQGAELLDIVEIGSEE